MNRIDKLFITKKTGILSVYFTAGYPAPGSTTKIVTALEENGADMIEIGIPFSDPVADGPVIQKSSHRALQNGMSLEVLLNRLSEIRNNVTIPLILMGYFNPVLQFGMEKLCSRLNRIGIDGLIIPDLPPEEYAKKYRNLFRDHNIHNILLVTPQTPDERIRTLDDLSSGFLYLVSASSTTGGKLSMDTGQKAYFSRVAAMGLSNPLMIGFGISDRESLDAAYQYAAGGIIGSAFIRALENRDCAPEENVKIFMNKLR
ncbi:MAG: tryptophan synthase subunit alpha [Chlorobi bacterium]|nr:tryptophan synthase subunit alpha [Chlorobiota bacterium]